MKNEKLLSILVPLLTLSVFVIITFLLSSLLKSCTTAIAQEDTTDIKSIENRVSKIEEEITQLQEENRLFPIIGAYTIINTELVDPTPENVKDLVLICECWYPDIIMAQYQLESSKGTSKVAKKNNNLFGMRKAQVRKSVRCKAFDSKGYAMYNNWQLSVIDRILWEEYEFNGKKPTRQEYLAKIKKIYAQDASYIYKIKKISEEYSYLRK